jgi:hypothetical protein
MLILCVDVIEDFALLEAGYTVVRIIQRFQQIELPLDESCPGIGLERQNLTLVVASADGCRVKFG